MEDISYKCNFKADKSKCIKCGKCKNVCSGLVVEYDNNGYPFILPFERFGWRGCKVIGTTHRLDKMNLLNECDEALLDDGSLENKIKVDKVLELIGSKTLKDSLKLLNKGGIVCQTGLLGGVYLVNNFDPIKDIPNVCYLTGFFSNYPTQEIIDNMFNFINEKKVLPTIGAIYFFDNIRQASMDIDNHKIERKVLIVL